MEHDLTNNVLLGLTQNSGPVCLTWLKPQDLLPLFLCRISFTTALWDFTFPCLWSPFRFTKTYLGVVPTLQCKKDVDHFCTSSSTLFKLQPTLVEILHKVLHTLWKYEVGSMWTKTDKIDSKFRPLLVSHTLKISSSIEARINKLGLLLH